MFQLTLNSFNLLLQCFNFQLGAKEQYFKEKINIIYQAIDSKEDNFEKLQRAARERVKQSNANPTRNEVGYR